jgi:hypothetical protein
MGDFDVNSLSASDRKQYYAASADGEITAEEFSKFSKNGQKVLAEWFRFKPTDSKPLKVEQESSWGTKFSEYCNNAINYGKKVVKKGVEYIKNKFSGTETASKPETTQTPKTTTLQNKPKVVHGEVLRDNSQESTTKNLQSKNAEPETTQTPNTTTLQNEPKVVYGEVLRVDTPPEYIEYNSKVLYKVLTALKQCDKNDTEKIASLQKKLELIMKDIDNHKKTEVDV